MWIESLKHSEKIEENEVYSNEFDEIVCYLEEIRNKAKKYSKTL